MNFKDFIDVAAMCAASILIGTFAVSYLLLTWIYHLIRSAGILFILIMTIVLSIYVSGFYFIIATINQLISSLTQSLAPLALIFENDRLNPNKLPNFNSILDAIGIFFAYFIAAAAFFTFFFYIRDILRNSMLEIRFILKSIWYTKRIWNESQNCSICLNEDAKFKLNCGHCYHYQCIKKWKIQKNSCPYCRAPIEI